MSDLPRDPNAGGIFSLLFGDKAPTTTIPDIPNTSSSAAGSAPPGPSNAINLLPDGVIRQLKDTQSNVLDNYIDVIYNISLGLISFTAAGTIQSDTSQMKDIGAEDYVIFASTAEARTNSTIGANYRDYYNIQSFSFTSFVGHEPQNPLIAVNWDGKMKIYEPYGFRFRDDMVAMAHTLGYPDGISPTRFYYRMEIWFSGWDTRTGAWVKAINIPNPQPKEVKQLSSIVYYFVITTIEAKLDATGTTYDLSFQTHSHEAFRSTAIAVRAGAHPNVLQGKRGGKFRDFLDALAKSMKQLVLDETANRIKITYQFEGLKELIDAKFAEDATVDFTHGVSYDATDGGFIVSANNLDMITLLHQTMFHLDVVRNSIMKQEDINFKEPSVYWNIRTNCPVATSKDEETNFFKEFTYQYIFEPVYTFRSRLGYVKDRNGKVTVPAQIDRLTEMIRLGMFYRWYDYYFTANNTEVIDLQFKFKNFYYQQILPDETAPEIRTLADASHNTADGPYFQKQAGQAASSQEVSSSLIANSRNKLTNDYGYQLLFDQIAPESASSNYTAGDKIQHVHRPATKINPTAIQTTGSGPTMANTLAASADYLQADMITANMTVRFDPSWLLNPYMVGGDATQTIDPSNTSGTVGVNAYTDRLIYINVVAPNQKSFMNPDTNLFTAGRNASIIAGIYQVIKIINEFDGGRFIQKIDMVKNPWQNHLGQYGEPATTSGGINGGTSGVPDLTNSGSF